MLSIRRSSTSSRQRVPNDSAQSSISLGGDEREAVLSLLATAKRLGRIDPALGQAAHLEALSTGFFLTNREVLEAVADALDASPPSESGEPLELMVRGWARLLQQGYPAGTELLREATTALRDKTELEESDLPLLYFTEGVTRSTWDFDSWRVLARRSVELARASGALSMLPRVLCSRADFNAVAGDFAAAAAALAEADATAEAMHAGHDWNTATLDSLRFREHEALARIEQAERKATSYSPYFDWGRALVLNAAGRYEPALEAAQRSCDLHPLGTFSWGLVELVEAAVRCGRREHAVRALEQLVDRTRLESTEWALGLEARCSALVSEDSAVAAGLYLEAIERLGRAGTRPDLARAHLVYGEWLRRENRRLDAREQLRTAHDMFGEIGMPEFAERARRELAATGETARKRTDETRDDLTAQETQIARLASDGLTNPQIGAQLFLSPRTVEWHLRRVYPKLGISSRKELRAALPTA